MIVTNVTYTFIIFTYNGLELKDSRGRVCGKGMGKAPTEILQATLALSYLLNTAIQLASRASTYDHHTPSSLNNVHCKGFTNMQYHD